MIVSEIDLTFNYDGSVWIYRNTKNKASFMVSKDNDVFYDDPFGNYMTSSPRQIRINFEHFVLKNYGDEIRKSDGTRMILMPKEQIQEIANKTFYADGQFHAVDFLTFTITEEKIKNYVVQFKSKRKYYYECWREYKNLCQRRS